MAGVRVSTDPRFEAERTAMLAQLDAERRACSHMLTPDVSNTMPIEQMMLLAMISMQKAKMVHIHTNGLTSTLQEAPSMLSTQPPSPTRSPIKSPAKKLRSISSSFLPSSTSTSILFDSNASTSDIFGSTLRSSNDSNASDIDIPWQFSLGSQVSSRPPLPPHHSNARPVRETLGGAARVRSDKNPSHSTFASASNASRVSASDLRQFIRMEYF